MYFFLISDSILHTTLSNKWIHYKYEFIVTEAPINKRTLYNMNINNQILAFTYNMVSLPVSKKLCIFFSIIPAHDTNIANMWESHYLKPTQITNINILSTVYICKELLLYLVKTNNCSLCNEPTYNKMCHNKQCLESETCNYYTHIKQGNILLSYSDIVKKPSTFIENCRKCESCKICKRKGKKCHLHITCKHNL